MVFREVKRILKKDGSFYLNIADTYVSGKGSCFNPGGGNESWNRWNDRKMDYPTGRSAPARMYKGILPKCMALIPERVEFALLLEGWRLRNKIIWHKPNNMPASVKDRFTQTWENLFFFVKSRRYYFDLDAVRVPHKTGSLARYQGDDGLFGDGANPSSFRLRVRDAAHGKIGISVQNDAIVTEEEVREFDDRVKHHGARMNNRSQLHQDRSRHGFGAKAHGGMDKSLVRPEDGPEPHAFNPKGKNPGDLWTISTRPSSISVCPQCDTVFRRLLKECPHCHISGVVGHFASFPEKLCIDPIKASTRVGDVVLDCFGGSGTTAVAAKRLGRHGIVIDCVRPYCVMARYNLQRVVYQAQMEV